MTPRMLAYGLLKFFRTAVFLSNEFETPNAGAQRT
jgi:hypothetical protein